jgi:hypothetical protein
MADFEDRLRDEMRGEHAPPDGRERLLERVRRRERGRRIAAAGLGLTLTATLAVTGYVTLRNNDRVEGPIPPATNPTTNPTTEPSTTAEPTPSPTDHPTVEPLPGAPPPVTVTFLDRSADLQAWTYCYEARCVDGGPGKLLDVGTPDRILVDFPLQDWSFEASFRPSGDDCGRYQSVALTRGSDGTMLLEPIGYADTYDVTLFGRGNGDLFVSFRWTTPTDGPLPEPTARLAILANDDPVTSYGIELYLSNLATTPSSERAIITVRAANGNELTFEAKGADRDCLPEGSVYWDGPDAKGLAAAELGDPPFTYEVELILDGAVYHATAVWPRDQIVGDEPSVKLDFSPALPALE